MGIESKISKYVEEEEIVAFLRDMADALDKKQDGKDELACVEDFRKIKITIKNEYGKYTIKTKIKAEEPCGDTLESAQTATGEPFKPDYKKLKKRMQGSFRMIFKMIHDGQMPPKAAVDSFLEDSKLMVTYPGLGDEFYDEYIGVCEAFRAAYEAGDMEKLGETVDSLSHEKSRCHAKYA